MSKVLIIGAGGVGRVVTHKCARLPEVFSEVMLASRTLAKCEAIAAACERPIRTAAVDADDPAAVERLIRSFGARLVINVALPYQNLPIMEACARCGVHYVDTSMHDELDDTVYDYGPQKAFGPRFQEAGVTGLLSIGFDPGVVNVYCAYAQKHLFDQIETIDIIDCNAGSNGLPFATNFDPETNLREVLCDVPYFEDGRWHTAPALTISREFDFPEVGRRRAYLMAHEEVLSIQENIPGVRNVRFWMTFNESYLTHVRVLRNLGLTEIKPVEYNGVQVIPLRFLKQVLPNPAGLGSRTTGKTSIACVIEGLHRGRRRRVRIANVCSHEAAYREVGSQAISYTTGVPAALAARLILEGAWSRPGAWTPEELDPDPFMDAIGPMGLPWRLEELPVEHAADHRARSPRRSQPVLRR
ncbi:MAG: saccharopine dehydrogenase family protein [Verrucomicrobia bacterium]|nr:MAG: saccharopine dehydrogenase family protein [Verrucomicrobiota bacterium]